MAKPKGTQVVVKNNRAYRDYQIQETLEAGIVLVGCEVKSARETAPSLAESFVEVRSKPGRPLEAWWVNASFADYSHGNRANPEHKRPRKLLIQRRQIEELHGALTRGGMTLVPTQLYFKDGRLKLEIGLARGKKKADRRDDVQKREAEREIERNLRNR